MHVSTNSMCNVGNTAKQCRLGLFQDSDFAGDLEDSKSTSGGTLCIFGSHTFVPTSWMEIISFDAGLHTDGIPALTLWDLVIEIFHSKAPGKPVAGYQAKRAYFHPNQAYQRHSNYR